MKDTVIIYNIENIILILYNSLFININNLLNTSKKFNKYKKKMYDWNLNKIWSREYYKNLFFNKYLNTQINDCSSQLSINLSGCIEVYKVDHIGNLKNLNLSGCINIINVDNLGNVENLNLCWCYKITNIDKLDKLDSEQLELGIKNDAYALINQNFILKDSQEFEHKIELILKILTINIIYIVKYLNH